MEFIGLLGCFQTLGRMASAIRSLVFGLFFLENTLSDAAKLKNIVRKY